MPFGIGLMKRRYVFLRGAKWQQERMYSEEDMRKAYDQGIDDSFDMGFSSKDDTNFNAFIEQFKKKVR
jgi:flagellar biosynthesis chaperone FliJ